MNRGKIEVYGGAGRRLRSRSSRYKNDWRNYFLTCKKWAENLEGVRDVVVAKWGIHLYQRFRLCLWAAANSFDLGTLCAHHMVGAAAVRSVVRIANSPARETGLFQFLNPGD